MADLAAASAARQTAGGGGTLKNEARAWKRYTEYCNPVRLGHNPFLDGMSRQHKIKIMGAFAVALCQGQFSRAADAPLAHITVGDTLNLVAATFRDNGRDDPKGDAENNVARLLRHQLRSYPKDDPKELQQKALPVCVLRLILASKSTEMRTVMGHLAAAAHFWAMSSCEYLKVPKSEQRQTKQLCLRNIAFIKDGKILNNSSTNLNSADCIAITFEQQKNNRKADTVTQWKTNDVNLCPVKIWMSIVKRIRSYKGTNPNSSVSLAKHGNKIISITSEMIVNLIRDGIVAIGETKHGINQSEIGSKSIRSGAAMAMYLAGTPVFSIMLVGRWPSTAFLKYIRKQVQEFSHGISSKMIEIQSFRHFKNSTATNPMENIVGNSFLLLME